MIEVTATKDGGRTELLKMTIENLSPAGDTGKYSVRIVVNTGESTAIYQRSIDSFERKKYNVLGLIRIALDTLLEKEFSLDADPDAPRTSDLARRLGRSMWPF